MLDNADTHIAERAEMGNDCLPTLPVRVCLAVTLSACLVQGPKLPCSCWLHTLPRLRASQRIQPV